MKLTNNVDMSHTTDVQADLANSTDLYLPYLS